MYDTMQIIEAPVSTIAVGWTASLGTVILAAGTKGMRYALPNATIHMHPAGGGARGYAPDVEIAAKELLRMQTRLHEILSLHTGQSVQQIADDFQRDRFMTAEEAVEYGLVDQILNMNDKKMELLKTVTSKPPEDQTNEQR
jgi:ATP-dependent Clp protease protease subunit